MRVKNLNSQSSDPFTGERPHFHYFLQSTAEQTLGLSRLTLYHLFSATRAAFVIVNLPYRVNYVVHIGAPGQQHVLVEPECFLGELVVVA